MGTCWLWAAKTLCNCATAWAGRTPRQPRHAVAMQPHGLGVLQGVPSVCVSSYVVYLLAGRSQDAL
eukprot:1158952-Pelagomonas_calceolata.AAC.6